METVLKKVLDQVRADDNLKKKTADYIMNADSNVIPMRAVAARKQRPLYIKRFAVAACAAAVLCALPIGGYAYYKTPTSYVSVDINPSLELGINSFGKVVSVKAYNEDGATVIAGLTLMNLNVESAIKHIVKSAAQNGFIKDDGSTFISVTAETNNDKKAAELKTEAQTGAEDAIESEDETATIETDTIALDRRDDAIALGITPGKLNLIQKLQALDPTISIEDFKDATVSEIQKKFIELKKEQNNKHDTDDMDATDDISDTDNTAQPSLSPSPSDTPLDASSGKPGSGNNNKPEDHPNSNSGAADKYDIEDASPDASPSSKPLNNGNSDHPGNSQKEDNGRNDKTDDQNGKENDNKNDGNNGKKRPLNLFSLL